MRALAYHVATSIDGYIAAPDGSYDAFPTEGDHIEMLVHELPETLPGPALTALGIEPACATYDTVVMGWNTFAIALDAGLASPYPHLRQYVCSRHHADVATSPDITVVTDDPIDAVRRLKAEPSDRDIWLCGGGQLAGVLAGEIDRLVVKVNPVVLGTGIPLFAVSTAQAASFTLDSSRTFRSGVVVNTYLRA